MRILFFDIDTLRPNLGCYGYHRNTSPNIDKIAEDGTIFTECYHSDVPCLPSRAAMHTGRFGIHNGVVGHGGSTADMRLTGAKREFQDRLKNDMFISQIRRAGLYPVSISPFAERHSAYWFYSGWREMYNPGKRGMEITDDIYPTAEKWLKNNGKQKENWFLHLNIWDPHTPYRTPDSFGNPFKEDPPPAWLTQGIIDKQRESYGPHSATEPNGWFVPAIPKDLFPDGEIKSVEEIRNLEDYKNLIDGYDTCIRYADDFVGKIVKILKEMGLYDDTLIIVSSDHGESQGELNVYGDHSTADHVINRIPMIIKWPDKNWKKEYKAFIYSFDVAATLLEGLGQDVPESWDGRSFLHQIESGKDFGREYMILSQNTWSCQRTVRFDNWTLIKTYHSGLKDFPPLMLFDYEKDFHMTENLASKKPEIVEKGLNLLNSWHSEMMKTSADGVDPMDTVLAEGGPYHTRNNLKMYLEELMRTGREHLVRKILEKNEIYWDNVTYDDIKKIPKKSEFLSINSKLGDILIDKQGREILNKHFGLDFFKRPQMKYTMNFQLSFLARFMPKILTSEKFNQVKKELNKIGEINGCNS